MSTLNYNFPRTSQLFRVRANHCKTSKTT